MYARLLCSVIRTIVQDHKWCVQYPFTSIQNDAVEALTDALALDKSDSTESVESAESKVISAIHKLGLALFCYERRDISKGDFACPVYRFLVMSCIREDCGFASELDVANTIAKLQWCCRAMVYNEMLKKMKRMTEKAAWKKVGKYVKEGRYTAFNSLRQVMHLASGITYNSPSLPQVQWLDDDYTKASINGKVVTFENIKSFVHERLESAESMLKRDILFGHDFKEFGYSCSKVVDVLRQRKVGYSFVDSMDNGFVKFKHKLLEVLLKDPLVCPLFIKRVRGRTVEWNKDGCKKWLKRTKAFLEIMMVVMHVSYGQPARAEELAATLIKNQILGMRSVYWCRELVMLGISYSKTRSASGKDKLVARFLPEEVGDVLVKYLALVRPMEAFIAKQIGCERFENYGKVLFTDHERAWDGEKLSDIFKSQTNAWGEVAMGFQEYRQVITLFMRKHLKELKWEHGDDILDKQAGHSSHTAGIRYGIGADDLAELSSDELLGFCHASVTWHSLLDFKVSKRRKAQGIVESLGTVESLGFVESRGIVESQSMEKRVSKE